MHVKKSMLRSIYLIFAILWVISPLTLNAQKTAHVHGKYTYVLSEDDNVTIKEAKLKSIEMARSEALKSEFGTMVVYDVLNTERIENDVQDSFYLMDTSSSLKGEWLADDKLPEVTMECVNGEILFTAEVWGTAREIKRAETEIQWQIMKNEDGKKIESDRFDSGERFFVKFSSPANGFVAIYLITADDETACLLPYRKDNTGRYPVKGSKEYIFFDKSIDPLASYYKLGTDKLQEYNQIVVIFSPNPFTKCMDTGGDSRKPSVINRKDFDKWLLKSRRADNEMVVSRKWITINSPENLINTL